MHAKDASEARVDRASAQDKRTQQQSAVISFFTLVTNHQCKNGTLGRDEGCDQTRFGISSGISDSLQRRISDEGRRFTLITFEED